MTQPLANRNAIVTGASQGLGFEIAAHYVKAGATLVICGREQGPLEQALSTLRAVASGNQQVHAMRADISDSGDVRALVAFALEKCSRLDILVNNAGVIGPAGEVESVDMDEWLRTMEINLFGAVYLCRAVVPHFKAQRSGKIIQISGGGATQPLPNLSAYAASKAALIRFMETLAKEVESYGIGVNSIAPGALNTRLLDELLEAGPKKLGKEYFDRLVAQKKSGGVPLQKGAELAVFLASDAGDGITGKLLSAAWDDWNSLPKRRAELQASDVYTLRRIIPADRKLNWES